MCNAVVIALNIISLYFILIQLLFNINLQKLSDISDVENCLQYFINYRRLRKIIANKTHIMTLNDYQLFFVS